MAIRTDSKPKTYKTKEVAERAGVSSRSVVRWVKAGKVPAPPRDRAGRRAFTEAHMRAIVEFANTLTPEAVYSSQHKEEPA